MVPEVRRSNIRREQAYFTINYYKQYGFQSPFTFNKIIKIYIARGGSGASRSEGSDGEDREEEPRELGDEGLDRGEVDPQIGLIGEALSREPVFQRFPEKSQEVSGEQVVEALGEDGQVHDLHDRHAGRVQGRADDEVAEGQIPLRVGGRPRDAQDDVRCQDAYARPDHCQDEPGGYDLPDWRVPIEEQRRKAPEVDLVE